MNIKQILGTIAAVIVATIGVSSIDTAAAHDADRVRAYFVPCTSDRPVAAKQEVKRCVFDAQHMSDSTHRASFKYGLGGKITFLSHKRAHRLLMTCGCPHAWR